MIYLKSTLLSVMGKNVASKETSSKQVNFGPIFVCLVDMSYDKT